MFILNSPTSSRRYLPIPLHEKKVIHGQFLNGVNGFETKSFPSTNWYRSKVKDLSLPYYLHINWRKIVGFISFARVQRLFEMCLYLDKPSKVHLNAFSWTISLTCYQYVNTRWLRYVSRLFPYRPLELS